MRMPVNTTCVKDGCEKAAIAKGLCRTHYTVMYRARKSTKPCPDCGKGILPEYERCQSCHRASLNTRVCIVCGVPISHRAHVGAKHCWACWSASRKEKAVKRCSVAGCEKPHVAKGMCRTHYRTVWRRRNPVKDTNQSARNWTASQPCQLCGYAKMRSHVHRLIPGSQGGQYVDGNMVALCSRCHDEVHAGITKPPKPLVRPQR